MCTNRSDRDCDKFKTALENWERWMKVRREETERLSKATGTEPSCLLMNRDTDRQWTINREKEIMFDAQLIKEYVCRCGKTGCPLFWKTTEPYRPGAKNLLAEVLFSPLKLTHENKKLSHLLEKGYVGQPRVILEEKGILGEKCFEASLQHWKNSNYYQQRKKELSKEIEEIQNFVPRINNLVVIGKKIIEKKEEKRSYNLPEIVIEEYTIYHQIPDETEPILSLGPLLLKGSDEKGIDWVVEFTGVNVNDLEAKYVKLTNRGQIAIKYGWKKKDSYRHAMLPLKITKDMFTRFFFDKTMGILLPGQSFYQMFWFRSRTPGIFREVWSLDTKPALPPVRFFLEGVVSQASNREKHQNNKIENYLNKLVKDTLAREMAEMAVHRMPCDKSEVDHATQFTEVDIFMETNPILYYHPDAVFKAKALYARFFEGEWNLSMDDLCTKLIERLRGEEESFRLKIMKKYAKLLKQLQRKPETMMDLTDSDWDIIKYHLSYLLMCSAIAEMEKCLNYKSWGLEPPNAPPGPEEFYEGNFTDSSSEDDTKQKEGTDIREDEEDTEEEEALLEAGEREIIQEFGMDAFSDTKTVNLGLGVGIKFGKEPRMKPENLSSDSDDVRNSKLDQEEEKKGSLYDNNVEEQEAYEKQEKDNVSLTDLLLEEYLREKGIQLEETEEEEKEEEIIGISNLKQVRVDNEAIYKEKIEKQNQEYEERVEKLKERLQLLEQMKLQKSKGPGSTLGTKTTSGPKNPKEKPKKKEDLKTKLKVQDPTTKQGEIPEENKSKPKVRKKKRIDDDDDLAQYVSSLGPPPPWVRKRFIAFAMIQWRQILVDAIDDISVLVESINVSKRVPPRTNIKFSERMHHPC